MAGFVRDPRSRRPLLTAAAVTVSVALAAVALGVFPVGGRAVRLGLHPAAKVAPLYLLVELGPLVVLGAVGAAALAYRGEFRAWRPLLVLFAPPSLIPKCPISGSSATAR